MLLAGLVAAAYGVSAVLRLHAEEAAARSDPVLSGAVGRVRWGLGHLVVAVTGTVLLLAVAGVATGLGYGLRAGDTDHQAARMLGAAMTQLPAALVITGIAAAAFGLLPDACAAVGCLFGVFLGYLAGHAGPIPRHQVTCDPMRPGGPGDAVITCAVTRRSRR